MDIKVDSVEDNVPLIKAGGELETPLYYIDIGKCTVVCDK